MAYPLTPEFIAECDAAFSEDITYLNSLGDEDEQIGESLVLWRGQINQDDVIEYSTALYLNMKFMEGHLHSTLFHWGPLCDDHKPTSGGTLAKLAEYGVFTTNGQCTTPKQRSYLNFVVAVKEDANDKFIDMLEKLHSDGFTITATNYLDRIAVKQVIFVDEGFKFHSRDFPIDGVNALNKEANQNNPNFARMHSCIKLGLHFAQVEMEYVNSTIYFDKPNVFSCAIWNADDQQKQADEALLTRWLEFMDDC